MSRIGKQIIIIPKDVTIVIVGSNIKITGPKGILDRTVPDVITVTKKETELSVNVVKPEDKFQRSLWGTWASHLKNMIVGVTDGFVKELEVNGIGYKTVLNGKTLVLNVGFSHPVEYTIPDDVSVTVEKNNIRISGIDKQKVGQVASEIRKIKPAEPYKGKGIKYIDEVVRRKAGKVAKGTTA